MLWVRARKSISGMAVVGFFWVLGSFGVTSGVAWAVCPNESVRTGASAALPECRAYEQVTPAEAEGQVFQDIDFGETFEMFPTESAGSGGNSLLFSTKGSGLLTPEGGSGEIANDVWQALRTPEGWRVSRHVTPAPYESIAPTAGGVSADHGYIFTFVGALGSAAVQKTFPGDWGSLYIKGGASYLGDPSGHFELTGCGGSVCEQYAQGRYISPGGQHVLFSTGKVKEGAEVGSAWCLSAGAACEVKPLESTAAPQGTGAIYDRPASGGPTRVISLLPNNVPAGPGENAFYQGASTDGRVVAFKINGVLYVRVNNEKTEEVTSAAARFGGLSADGRYLFYISGGDIDRFDTQTESTEQVNASGDALIANVSDDGSHVYFLSESELGASGTAGQPNLYVWSNGTLEFVATVVPSDVEGIPALGNWVQAVNPSPAQPRGPGVEASRVTPNGGTIVFESAAQLTSYDNSERTEIYRREDGQAVECVSCNPSGTPATSGARLQSRGATGSEIVVNNLSADGSRVFFETQESLIDEDTDGINDAYEWHSSTGGGGNLGLISSGRSLEYPFADDAMEQNILVGVSRDGSDVFFRSMDALVAGAGVGGTPAIYDARIEGGFPEPVEPIVCAEEDCRPPPAIPPTLSGAASAGLQGAGNLAPRKRKHHSRRRSCSSKGSHHGPCSRKRAKASELAPTPRPSGGDPAASAFSAADQSDSASPSTTTSPVALAGSGEFENYGIKAVQAGASTSAAAHHPDFTTTLEWKNPKSEGTPRTQSIAFKLPPGLYGNPTLVPPCTTGEFLAQSCPIDSQVGIVKARWAEFEPSKNIVSGLDAPLYSLSPVHPDREIARFGFNIVEGLALFVDVSVRTAGDYGVTATVHAAPSVKPLLSAETIIWGNPADSSHNKFRLTPQESRNGCKTACEAPGGERSTEKLGPVAFLTNPSECQQGSVGFEVSSYQLPGQVFTAEAPMAPVTNCQDLPFSPTFSAEPTTRSAGAPTGLKTALTLPQSSDPSVPSTATMREARVTLPEGMTISAGAADGLAACSNAEVHLHEEVDAACPDASKLGTVKIVSPALSTPLEGAVYQRAPESGHLFRLWLVVDQLGLHVKLPGEIEPDPKTGQVTAVFRDLPQVPVEEIDLDVWGGPRAPLKNPDSCGSYSTTFSFAPHSQDAPVTGQAPMSIDQGCGPREFDPKLGGGTTDPRAGGFSPFVFDLIREDGEQNLAGFKVTLPAGVSAKLKGVSLCPDPSAGSGACPADSKIGSVTGAAGPGPNPLWLPQPGKASTAVYLAGPYDAAPYSIVSVVPAQAGPFDLGNVVVRSPLRIDPESARATVEAEPLPQIIAGVPIAYRRLHVVIDRPEFTLNPTNCSQLAITSDVSSAQGTVVHPAVPFEVDGCKALKFQPTLALKLKGGTKRADYPAFVATLKARRGDANLGRVSVALPHSEFLAQEHIGTICTRVQFAAHKCPKASIYGKAKAWTPLLDEPLQGPVYLRSSSHPLPDLVLDLKGQIEVAVVGRIDSKNGGIRNTFDAAPDAPVSKVVVHLFGGKKGILTNSQNICVSKHRATVKMRAQNGRVLSQRPVLKAQCGKKK